MKYGAVQKLYPDLSCVQFEGINMGGNLFTQTLTDSLVAVDSFK